MWWNRTDSIDVLPSDDPMLADREDAPTFLHPPNSDMDQPASAAGKPERSINARFFFLSLGALALLLVGAHFLHAYQMQRISSVYFTNAQKAVEAGESQDAIRFLRQYLNFHPQDLEARVLLAKELAKLAVSQRELYNVLLIYEGILRADPNRSDLRFEMVDMYRKVGEHRDALVHVSALLHLQPKNPELLLHAAECYEALYEADNAVATYRELLRWTPGDAQIYERMAFLLREDLERPEAADQLIQELLDSNQRNSLAFAVRARYRHRFGELRHAARDARIAYQLDPQNFEVIQLVAIILTDQLKAGEDSDFLPAQVRSDLERFLEQHPQQKSTIKALIDLDLADGQLDLAEARLRGYLESHPRDVLMRFQLADLLQVTQRMEESKTEVDRLREIGVTVDAANFLRARGLMVQERWLDAIRILERVNINSRKEPEIASSVYRQLGQCYEQIGHHHRGLQAFRDAVAANPHSVEARLGLASALVRVGRIDEALNIYQQFQARPEVSLSIAGLNLLKQLLLPNDERSWEDVESALAQATRENADPDKTLRFRVMVLVAQDQLDQARKILQQERNKRPDALAVWLLSAELENGVGQSDAARQLLKTAQSRFGNSVELDLAQLRFQTQQPGSNNADWVLSQMESWDDLPETFRVPALGELANSLESSAQSPGEALKVWLEIASRKPDDLRVWRRVLPLALAAKDDEVAQQAVREIRRIEGATGAYWRLAEADRCLMHARQGQAEFDLKAQTLLENLVNELPSDWSIPFRLAEIAERQGDSNRAIENYKAILHLEMYHPQVVKRLVQLLSSKGRDEEAEGYLTKLQRSRPLSFGARYGRMASVIALRSQHRIRALELAREAVKADSQDPEDHLWLGQILSAIGMPQEAENAFRKSISLAPQQAPARVALVRLLEKNRRREDARNEILELRTHVPEQDAKLPLAYCLEITSQAEEANQAYQHLVESEPRNGYLRWVLAEYFLRSERGKEAETILRSLLDPSQTWNDTPVPEVRRSLVQRLLQKPGYPANAEALALIESSLKETPNSVPDLRIKAHLLAGRQSRTERLKGLAVFDQLMELGPESKEDLLQRIQLLQTLNRRGPARESLLKLLSLHQDDLNVLRIGIGYLLEWGEVNTTTSNWLTRLEEQSPDAYSTKEFKAQFLVGEGKADQAVRLLANWKTQSEDDPDTQLTRLEQVSLTLMKLTEQEDRLGRAKMADVLGNAAEKALAELTQLKPERVTWKIRFLIGRWQLDEAWQLIEPAWKTAPATEVAAVLLSLLQKSREDQRSFSAVKDSLEDALHREPNSIGLELTAATIAQLCGEYDLAIALYRSALKKNPNIITAQNELAVLYSLRGQPAEHSQALKLIDQAIHQAGPLHFLLDTKATVLLALNQPRPAIQLLNQAIADSPSPAKSFHLMQAHLLLNQRPKAKRVYQTALAEGFQPTKLHPLEQAAARSLIQDLQK